MNIFPNIDPDEKATLTFRFANGLSGGEMLSSASLAITVVNGIDAAPSTHFSAPQISGTDILVAVAGLTGGTSYHIRAIVPINNSAKTLVLGATLPCVAA